MTTRRNLGKEVTALAKRIDAIEKWAWGGGPAPTAESNAALKAKYDAFWQKQFTITKPDKTRWQRLKAWFMSSGEKGAL